MGVHFHLHTALCRLFGFLRFLRSDGGGVGVLLIDADVPAFRLSTPSTVVTRTMWGARFSRHDFCLVGGHGRSAKRKAYRKKLWEKGGEWGG